MEQAEENMGSAVSTQLRRLVQDMGIDATWADRGHADIVEVVIAEPGEDLAQLPGALVLAVGARGADAVDAVRAASGAGAVAVAVRAGADGRLPEPVRRAADEAGIAALGIPDGVRWDRVAADVRGLVEGAARGPAPDRRGDLFSLAQTVATLTHGVVSIEDGAHRVMAYSDSGDEADELRRRSILGRTCPEPYLAMLRQSGVFRRVRDGQDVVQVEARPELGGRRRLAIGINAGSRPLGTIWVQEGSRPLADRSDEALRGAARLAASQLVDHWFHGDSAARLPSRAGLAHGLLTGRFNSAALAAHLGIAPTATAAVVAFDLREPGSSDATWRDARRAEAAEIVSVHAASYRRSALVAEACGQIYAMLPESSACPRGDDGALTRWAEDLVGALRRHLRTPVQAVVAGTAARLDDIPDVKLRGHHGLRVLARTPDRQVATHGDLTASLMVRDVVDLLARSPGIRHPALEELAGHDARTGTELCRSLLQYLDAFGDVAAAAKELNVHPNTLRYRIRKAVTLTGLDLDDPEHRLAAVLQLRLSLAPPGTSPFPGG
ncbi:helix-turn-helix domain-containing protein [Streptomyces sp. NBC_00234]|uniref:PucR family transcriptional regulator n=1 Tax=Streptomyces sp. NBC_00234 TaxID=2903638 RepID=UPI002E2C90A6|nr:helix-turn-helix domain-containing protein [Streptomyces sp. NBC_00234]